jgi:NACalpha-BTF3-like transcription factor
MKIIEWSADVSRGNGAKLTVAQLRRVADFYDYKIPSGTLKPALVKELTVVVRKGKTKSSSSSTSTAVETEDDDDEEEEEEEEEEETKSPKEDIKTAAMRVKIEREFYKMADAGSWNADDWKLPIYFSEVDSDDYTALMRTATKTDLLPMGTVVHVPAREGRRYARRLYTVAVKVAFDEMLSVKVLLAEPTTETEHADMLRRHTGAWNNFPYRDARMG